MQAFARRFRCVGVAHLLDHALDLGATFADDGNAFLLFEPLDRLRQSVVERCASAIFLGAIMHNFGGWLERVDEFVGRWWARLFVIRLVAARLDNQRRAIGATEMADIFQPTAERLVT